MKDEFWFYPDVAAMMDERPIESGRNLGFGEMTHEYPSYDPIQMDPSAYVLDMDYAGIDDPDGLIKYRR